MEFVLVELPLKHFCLALKALTIFRSPPFAEISFIVIFGAVVIKAVRYLVPDDSTNGAVIDTRIKIWPEVGRLEDGGREGDLVCSRIIVGVYCLRIHMPFAAVHRLLKLAHITSLFISRTPQNISEVIIWSNQETSIVLPLVWVTDLAHHHREFLERTLLRSRAHPVELLDAVAIRGK